MEVDAPFRGVGARPLVGPFVVVVARAHTGSSASATPSSGSRGGSLVLAGSSSAGGGRVFGLVDGGSKLGWR